MSPRASRSAPGLMPGLLLLLLVLGPASVARAQGTAEAFLYQGAHQNTLHAEVRMDPALGFGLGYMRSLPLDLGRFHRRLGVHAEVETILGFSSWDFAGGVSMFLAEGAGFNALVRTDIELKVAQNRVHTGLTYGYDLSLRAGYFDPIGYVAAELSVHGAVGGSLWHRRAYREAYPGVRDGDYLLDHASVFFGAAVGFQIEDRLLLGLRFAWRFAKTFQDYTPYVQPYTVNLEIGVRF